MHKLKMRIGTLNGTKQQSVNGFHCRIGIKGLQEIKRVLEI